LQKRKIKGEAALNDFYLGNARKILFSWFQTKITLRLEKGLQTQLILKGDSIVKKRLQGKNNLPRSINCIIKCALVIQNIIFTLVNRHHYYFYHSVIIHNLKRDKTKDMEN
jgi:hypothetical protein